MPRKLRVNKAKEQVTESEWKYLCDEPLPDNFEKFILDIDSKGNIEQLWELQREVILAEHAKDQPGTRPALWWRLDAPRLPIGTFKGCHYDGQLPEPRKRLGGTGHQHTKFGARSRRSVTEYQTFGLMWMKAIRQHLNRRLPI
jgi:hypothetical protein